MGLEELKPLPECLDILLRQLVEDWNNYGDDRKDLNSDDLLKRFGLKAPYLKHEFFVGVINHLIKDGYAALIESRQYNSEISNYQKNTIITITGYYLIMKEGGYTKKARTKWIMELPKRYWWVIGIIAFFVGFFADLIQDKLKQKWLSPSSKEAPMLPISADTPQTHKIVVQIDSTSK